MIKSHVVMGGNWSESARIVPERATCNAASVTKRSGTEHAGQFRYRSKRHQDLPHIVKFSGGRSSAMLLFNLLEDGLLQAHRGDVIIFNNTSCEHPATYRFVSRCKRRVERDYGIPFFLVEFQTHEDARRGEWTRIQSYRLVNDRPVSSTNPDGFHWKGEVFEELLSHDAYVPNQFRRTCTATLKLEASRLFLQDWFAGKEGIPRLGHTGSGSRVDLDVLYKRHESNRGGVPRELYLQKKRYVLSRPPSRPSQKYGDFSAATTPFSNASLDGKVFGNTAWFGTDGVEYVTFIGIRGDEQRRVARVAANVHAKARSDGEHVYMPFAERNVTKADVSDYWRRRDWDLKLPTDGSLSNCVFCFLKGVQNLDVVYRRMGIGAMDDGAGFGPIDDTPCDLKWWVRMEQTYGRDLVAENRPRTGDGDVDFVGFFGASSGFSYDTLATSGVTGDDLSQYTDSVLPCDCTD
ncbi:MAG: hypothetical protein OXQ31_06450 [Spirochaetaceae bacterium]|nr:hypothetical protein [Spirochaetaceae bacterium]